MKRLSFVMLLACPLALAAGDSAFDLTLAGKKCKETDLQTLKCTYEVGDDLKFTITGVGQPNALIAFDRSSFDADYYGAVGVLHGCVVVRSGEKKLTADAPRLPEFAFVSPKNGKVYEDWRKCKSGY